MVRKELSWRFVAMAAIGMAWVAPAHAGTQEGTDKQEGTAKAAGTSAPAVSATNGKLQAAGGLHEGDGAGYGAASLAFPLGHQFGGQVDAYGGSVGGALTAGGAGHLFWRDPDVGLLGIYGSRAYMDVAGGMHMSRIGLSGDAYLDRVTVSTMVGGQFGDVLRTTFTSATLAYYPTDDLQLFAGHRLNDVGHTAAVGAEWLVHNGSSLAVSGFTEAAYGESGTTTFWAGVRLYLGARKTLIRRHREDDPAIMLPNDLFSLSTSELVQMTRIVPPPSVSAAE